MSGGSGEGGKGGRGRVVGLVFAWIVVPIGIGWAVSSLTDAGYCTGLPCDAIRDVPSDLVGIAAKALEAGVRAAARPAARAWRRVWGRRRVKRLSPRDVITAAHRPDAIVVSPREEAGIDPGPDGSGGDVVTRDAPIRVPPQTPAADCPSVVAKECGCEGLAAWVARARCGSADGVAASQRAEEPDDV